MPHHSLKHLYCSATEDYPDRGIFKSLFVSFLLQHSIPQWCPKCQCSRFRQSIPLGQSLSSRLSLPLTNDPITQKASILEGAGHHHPSQGRDCCIRDGESVPSALPEAPPGCGAAFGRGQAAAQACGERWAGTGTVPPRDHEPGTTHSALAAATQPLWAHPSSGHVCVAKQSPGHRSATNDRGTTALSALFCCPDSKNSAGL